jgi:hypothetical protein
VAPLLLEVTARPRHVSPANGHLPAAVERNRQPVGGAGNHEKECARPIGVFC